MKYSEEDDTLEIFWARPERADMTGFALEDDIILCTDNDLSRPVRLMLSAYSKLLQESRIELTELPLMPPDKQARVRRLLQQSPLNCFLQFDSENSVRVLGAVWNDLAA